MAFTAEEARAYRQYRKMQGQPVPRGGARKPWHKTSSGTKMPQIYVGIDTEGETHENGHHYTTMIAYSSKDGKVSDILRAEPGKHLSSIELLSFIVSIPAYCVCFSYSFGYDISKIIQDVTNEGIYKLVRPNLRPAYEKAFMGRHPVKWKQFRLNLDNLRFTVGVWPEGGKKKNVGVWDLIRFCQAPFVARGEWNADMTPVIDAKTGKQKLLGKGALEMWNIGTEEERAIIRRMKTKRSDFTAQELDEIQDYTLLECRKMAELAERIIAAHRDLRTPSLPNGLELKRFDGPGSTVTSLFREWRLVEFFKEGKAQYELYDEGLQHAIRCAYFGGRFENRYIGEVAHGWNKDINSAYPYQACRLPCIIHGKWRRTKSERDARNSCVGIVRYRFRKSKGNCEAWGPLPLRLEDGCICYPSESEGGWVFRDEFFTAYDSGLWPGLVFEEAWVFERNCVCPNPLRFLAELYKERDRVGKDTGEGQVLKLGPNSCYGKLAQSIGEAPYQNWVLAGLIPSGCRVQGLEGIVAHDDPFNMLGIATDGILSLEDVQLPNPAVTGAEDCKKPLGGWDSDEVHNIFLIRPGMSVGTKLKNRGVSTHVLKAVADAIVYDWKTWRNASHTISAPNESRFIGARQGVYYVPRTREYRRRDEYGDWYTRPQQISLDPRPKRDKALRDGTLTLRSMKGITSVPYKSRTPVDAEFTPKERADWEDLDQPDAHDDSPVYQ